MRYLAEAHTRYPSEDVVVTLADKVSSMLLFNEIVTWESTEEDLSLLFLYPTAEARLNINPEWWPDFTLYRETGQLPSLFSTHTPPPSVSSNVSVHMEMSVEPAGVTSTATTECTIDDLRKEYPSFFTDSTSPIFVPQVPGDVHIQFVNEVVARRVKMPAFNSNVFFGPVVVLSEKTRNPPELKMIEGCLGVEFTRQTKRVVGVVVVIARKDVRVSVRSAVVFLVYD